MNIWYDKKGRAIDMAEASRLLEDPNYKGVKEDTLPNGKWVSTVWIGLDHQFGNGPPLIFETMVFSKKGNWQELDRDRYSTQEDALKGHKRMVRTWKARKEEK
jgi:hypothetical protein